MKIIKTAIVVVIIVLIFNALGMFNAETSQKVDNAVEMGKIKIGEFKYKDKPIVDMSLKELSSNISSDIKYLKEEVITDDGVKLSGKGLTVTINPKKDKILVAQVDATETKAVESIEKLLYDLTKKDIKIPDEFLKKTNLNIVVEKIDGEYNVKFK
ncbi:hypothetical protein [Tissierella praeacuta]|uniref:hypothetical protein n=1 Tax=Tissierella praeacuta TaxID=43131 RepID=UPI001C0F6BA7|nr:hypothetical protein [Tissierella praeacuta]MBU5255415.1 hypothetical protein [Tissierella praeacuta]